MKFLCNNGELTVYLEGRIDSSNADAVRNELEKTIGGAAPQSLVLNLEKLNYISSAGLRVILYFRKKFENMKLTEVSPDVYDVFEMTGFSEMMTVEKAFRSISVEGCEIIGKGANGTVYRIDPDTIVKVYRDSNCLEDIKRERELAHKAFVLGVPTAIPYDIVRVGETYGSVFELLNAKSFLQMICQYPEQTDEYVRKSVEIMKTMHSTKINPGDMPDMKKEAIRLAKQLKDFVTEAEENKLCALLEAVPDRTTMLHGDFQFKNIMMTKDEALIIDMDTLCYGYPIFELAFMYNPYVGYGEYDAKDIINFFGISPEKAKYIWRKTLSEYLGTEDEKVLSDAEDKARLVGLIRVALHYGKHPDKYQKEMDYYLNELKKLLPRVGSLVIEGI